MPRGAGDEDLEVGISPEPNQILAPEFKI